MKPRLLAIEIPIPNPAMAKARVKSWNKAWT
jgi:hypothetical protein